MQNLSKETKVVRVSNAVAAGTTVVNCTHVDTSGFENVTFLAAFGVIVAGAVTSVKAQQGDAADDSDMADIDGAAADVADDADNKVAVLEVVRPTKKFVRLVISRATQNATIDDVEAILTGGRKLPVVPDSTVSSTTTVVVA
jgi:hypothetical protein